MARTLLIKLTTVLSLLIITLSLHCQMAFSTETSYDDDNDQEYYEVDSPLPQLTSRSRFLATVIKKGAKCNPNYKNICNGISANKGTEILRCCKNKCVNVLGDMNHCGQCGRKCKQGERCCSGACINVLRDAGNCGKCGKKCKKGVQCRIGFCGYAY